MSQRITDAIVIVEPDQPGDTPACAQDYGDTPVLVHVLRQLNSLGINHVLVSASRAHERAVRPILAGFDGLPVCDMVPAPREGADGSAAAFVRCRRQVDSTDLLVTRASILSEPDNWLEQMMSISATNVAVLRDEIEGGPSWLTPAWIASGKLRAKRDEAIEGMAERCFLSGTYALRATDADQLYEHLKTSDDRGLTMERAVLEWAVQRGGIDAVVARKTAWLCAETTFWP